MVLRKHITIEEFSDGFQFSVNAGWREDYPEDPLDVGLDVISNYADCESGRCGNIPYHFPPVWEDDGKHDKKHRMTFTISDDIMQRLEETKERHDKEREFPNIIKKYREQRDAAQIS